jgi:dinuclear metal center YbgI/SA1388 family protein
MPTPLDRLLEALELVAPLHLAEEWDNVGLLVDAPTPTPVRRCMLTIDLTEPVLDHAIARDCQLVVAYHPPIFAPLGRLSAAVPKERILLRAIRAGIAVYSPHTALDAARGGVNDWLADGLGDGERRCVAPARGPGVAAADEGTGPGRLVSLTAPIALASLVERVKRHLGLEHVRMAVAAPHAAGHPVRHVALCAGAGGSVLRNEAADVWLTGELRHHDVMDALARGTSVILCEHTNTERGYLTVLQRRLSGERSLGVEFVIAGPDCEPLRVV